MRDIYEDIENGRYTPTITKPTKSENTCKNCGTYTKSNFCHNCGFNMTEYRKIAKIDYKNRMEAYCAETSMKENLFKKELFEYYEIDINHPKADILFKLAWDYGHSNGLSSVANSFEDFSDLIS